MVERDLVVGLVISGGVALVSYGLAVKKENPIVSSTIFTIIGSTAGLLGILAALTRDGSNVATAGSITGGLGSMALAMR